MQRDDGLSQFYLFEGAVVFYNAIYQFNLINIFTTSVYPFSSKSLLTVLLPIPDGPAIMKAMLDKESPAPWKSSTP